MKKVLHSDKAPKPIGPYSHAIGFQDLIFTCGQVGLSPEGVMISEDVKGQTKRALENLKNILEDNGSSLNNVIKTTVFLTDMKDFADMNEIYGEYFKDSFPARSTIAVKGLPANAKVEIEVIAFKK